jgi:hypothetical protein
MKQSRADLKEKNKQIVGNMGLYYVCYRLSRLGWNVMPTARNARGIDVLIYSQDATRTHAIQVKTLSDPNPVGLGKKLDGLVGDFFVICRNVSLDAPECFVLTLDEVRSLAHRRVKKGKVSHWLQRKQYETRRFENRWDRIGKGSSTTLPTEQL